MWTSVAKLIIRFRLPLILVISAITVFMGIKASKVEMSYDFARTVPQDDPDMLFLNKFKEQFGEDGNIIAVGLKDSSIYQLDKFEKFRSLGDKIRAIPGINNVLGLPQIKLILKDTANKRFYLTDLFKGEISTQNKLDSLMGVMRNQKTYMGQIVNPANGATMLLVSVNKEVINSSKRVEMTDALVAAGSEFSKNTGIELRYAGLPFVRAVVATQVRKELSLFLYLSAIVTGLIMFLFFRSFRAVLFSMIVIGIVVVWVIGTLALFGFKITLLSGLIPPVIVTIGITNAIYLLNKYHLEYAKYKDKERAIASVVNKMGLATFLTNLTVAIGFLTLLSTDVLVLREFGIVAATPTSRPSSPRRTSPPQAAASSWPPRQIPSVGRPSSTAVAISRLVAGSQGARSSSQAPGTPPSTTRPQKPSARASAGTGSPRCIRRTSTSTRWVIGAFSRPSPASPSCSITSSRGRSPGLDPAGTLITAEGIGAARTASPDGDSRSIPAACSAGRTRTPPRRGSRQPVRIPPSARSPGPDWPAAA